MLSARERRHLINGNLDKRDKESIKSKFCEVGEILTKIMAMPENKDLIELLEPVIEKYISGKF